MLKFSKQRENCVGCTACKSVCPVNCIEMIRDTEGFVYPMSSNKCIHCGKCEKICPIINKREITNTEEKRAFAAVSRDEEIWRKSASGDAFSEICKVWCDDETIICGAVWNGLSVQHKCVLGVDNIGQFRKSKYVESELMNCFSEIRCYLEKGVRVLFSGTPCQVSGLRSFLSKDYEKLLLVDIICHGVGSQDVFKWCISGIGEQFHGVVKRYEFRAKREKYEYNHLQRLSIGEKEIYLRNDQYMQLFLSQTCLRPSCGENCKFRNENRQGDITIADFKGLIEVFPNLLGSLYNYSSIVVNTQKGNGIIDKLKNEMTLKECTIEDIKTFNPLFYRQTEPSKEREKFFKDFESNPSVAIKKWTKPAEIARVTFKRKLFNHMPLFLRKLVLKVREGGITASEYDGCSLSHVLIVQNQMKNHGK